MRILMVTSFPIPGEYDGTAMLPIKILRALKPRGVDVVVAHLRAQAAVADWPARGATSRARRSSPCRRPAWVSGPGLERIAREFPFDLVHAQHYGGATAAYRACRRHGWPMVYEIHSLLGDEVERDRLGRGLVFRAYRALEQRVCRHAAADHRPGRAGQAGRRRGEGRPGRPGQRDLPGHRPGRVRAARPAGRRSRASAPSTR